MGGRASNRRMRAANTEKFGKYVDSFDSALES
jgi:hypothetical protein